MKLFKKFYAFLAVSALALTLAACDADGGGGTVELASGDWESIEIHNEIAMYIMEHGYDQEAEATVADTPIQFESLRNGSFHVNLEAWVANLTYYDGDIEDGYYHEHQTNFIDPGQGLYIPGYLQDEYEIYTIQDLHDHKELFEHPEAEGDRSLIYGGPLGWAATNYLETKFTNDEDYPEFAENWEFYPQGSMNTLNQTLQNAYENEEPWVGYHFAPTWPHAVFDLRYLEDELDYDADKHESHAVGDLPAGDVTVVTTDGFDEEFPEIYEFISNYATSTEITSDIIRAHDEYDLTEREAAIWFLQEYEDVWTEWVDEDVASLVLDALEGEDIQ